MMKLGYRRASAWLNPFENPGIVSFQVDAGFRAQLRQAWGDREFSLQIKETGAPIFVLSRPIYSEEHPAFQSFRGASYNPVGAFGASKKGKIGTYWVVPRYVQKCHFFSKTSKMNCTSWSLPAGSPVIGGSCPTATAMLAARAANAEAHANTVKAIERATGIGVRQQGVKSEFICDFCYAGKGNYANASTQLWQILRAVWQEEGLRDGTFVGTMVAAIRANISRLQRSRTAWKDENPRFFRIHDSGDFTGIRAIEAWKAVARALPDVRFWAPTRAWVFFADALAEACPSNLVIRPSALHFSDPAPVIRGLAGGSTAGVSDPHQRIWECPAYKAVDRDGNPSHTCRDSLNPRGRRECRGCWGVGAGGATFKNYLVSYHAH